MLMTADLTNQVAVVSGASSGIGKAIALGLVQAGANVYLIGRCLKKLQAIAASYPNFSQRMVLYPADLSIDADIHTLATTVQKNHGGIDIVVHSAGVIALSSIRQASIHDFDYQYAINVRAAYLLTQALLPALKSHCGQIVYINSSVGLAARAGVGQYAATKHALKAIADSVREEVNADGIRVLSVYPGRTASPMQQTLHETEGMCYQPNALIQPEDVASVVIHALSLPHTAEVTDIHIRPFKKMEAK